MQASSWKKRKQNLLVPKVLYNVLRNVSKNECATHVLHVQGQAKKKGKLKAGDLAGAIKIFGKIVA